MAWAIENMLRRQSATDQAHTTLRDIFEATLLAAELVDRIAARQTVRSKKVPRDATCRSSIVVKDGDREDALSFIRDWIAGNVITYLKIYDPYFGPEDLEVLKLVLEVKPECGQVFIITSRAYQGGVAQPWAQSYSDFWHTRLSDQAPPDTEIVIVGTETHGEPPIHDRWWVADRGGLSTGTSFHSLGSHKSSEVRLISPEEALAREAEIDAILARTTRKLRDEKLIYDGFTLR